MPDAKKWPDDLNYIVLSTNREKGPHHVYVERANGWLRYVTSFADYDRATDYAECENGLVEMTKVDNDDPIESRAADYEDHPKEPPLPRSMAPAAVKAWVKDRKLLEVAIPTKTPTQRIVEIEELILQKLYGWMEFYPIGPATADIIRLLDEKTPAYVGEAVRNLARKKFIQYEWNPLRSAKHVTPLDTPESIRRLHATPEAPELAAGESEASAAVTEHPEATTQPTPEPMAAPEHFLRKPNRGVPIPVAGEPEPGRSALDQKRAAEAKDQS